MSKAQLDSPARLVESSNTYQLTTVGTVHSLDGEVVMNMGTPEHPEGVPHWSNVAMFAQKLEGRRRRQEGFWLFFRECCGRCDGGDMVENILTDVTAVKREEWYGPFRPDILLERGGKPPVFLEFTHTSQPSAKKLAFCSAEGIDVFELDGSRRPSDSGVLKAHIAPHNCRQALRARLLGLWDRMEALDDPVVGVVDDWTSSSLHWHFRLQEEEMQAFGERFARLRQAVREGRLKCARCDEPFEMNEDGNGYHASFIETHRLDGGCGQVPMCRNCEIALRGGWHGDFPEDANSWGLDDECSECRPLVVEQERRLAEVQPMRSVEMPEPYGSRVVAERQRRPQGYVVGDQTVSRSELLAVLMLVQYALIRRLESTGKDAFGKDALMLEEVDRVGRAVLYANNDLAWDWLEGIGESYVSEADVPDDSVRDKFLYPRRWWKELPPCPLTVV